MSTAFAGQSFHPKTHIDVGEYYKDNPSQRPGDPYQHGDDPFASITALPFFKSAVQQGRQNSHRHFTKADQCIPMLSQDLSLQTDKIRMDGFSCKYCGDQFTSKTGWKNHIMAHEGQYRFVCEICNRGFMIKTDYEGHVNVHLNRKPFECENCKRTFSYKQSLWNHKTRCCQGNRTKKP